LSENCILSNPNKEKDTDVDRFRFTSLMFVFRSLEAHVKKPVYILSRFLIVVAAILLSACSKDENPAGSTLMAAATRTENVVNEAPLTIQLSGAMKQLEPIFKESGIPMYIEYRGDVELRLTIEALNRDSQDQGTTFKSPVDVFGTAGDIWMPGSFVRNKTRLTNTYSILMVDPAFAESQGWDVGNALTVDDLDRAVGNGGLIGTTSASQDGTGALFMMAYLQEKKGSDDPLTLIDLQNNSITEAAETLYESVVENLSNVDLLVKRVVNQRLEGVSEANLLLLPENAALALNTQLVENGKQPMLAFYVDGLTSIQTLIIGCSSGISEAKAAKCSELATYLTSEEVQQKMLNLGYRAVPVGMKVEDPSAEEFFRAEWGFMPDREFVLAFPPKDAVVMAAQTVYQAVLRGGSLTVMCLDHTGSMRDNGGIEQLRSAMQVILLQDNDHAGRYLLQATPEDLLFLLPFSTFIQAEYGIEGSSEIAYREAYETLVRNHQPDGGTDIYGCAVRALDVVNNHQDGTRLAAIILLTDGEHTGGMSFRDLQNHYSQAGNGTPIYSVVLGYAVLDELRAIADLTNGDVCDGRGGEEALARCFLEFRGNN
jgi:Ca-activated chloride channel family protein